MSHIIDFENAKKRLADSAATGRLNFSEELKWANDEIDRTSDRFSELSEEIAHISEYMVYLNTYIGACSVAGVAKDPVDQNMLEWFDEFHETLDAFSMIIGEPMESPSSQLEFDFEDEEFIIEFIPDGWSLDDDNR